MVAYCRRCHQPIAAGQCLRLRGAHVYCVNCPGGATGPHTLLEALQCFVRWLFS